MLKMCAHSVSPPSVRTEESVTLGTVGIFLVGRERLFNRDVFPLAKAQYLSDEDLGLVRRWHRRMIVRRFGRRKHQRKR
jgi:hypothetical protein